MRAAAYPTLTFLAFLLAWELVVRIGDVASYLVPPVSEVIEVMVVDAGSFLPDIWVTTREILVGFAASVVIGIPLAVFIVSFKPAQAALYPLLVASQVLPKVAIAPLFIIWFGFGWFPKVLVVFLISFFPIVIDTVIGFRSLEIEKMYLARSMGASWLQTFLKIRIPHALPSIFGGLKLAITLAVIGAVVAEFVGADAGLAYVMQNANANLDTVKAFAAIGYITIIGIVLFLAVEFIERLALPWHVSQRIPPAAS